MYSLLRTLLCIFSLSAGAVFCAEQSSYPYYYVSCPSCGIETNQIYLQFNHPFCQIEQELQAFDPFAIPFTSGENDISDQNSDGQESDQNSSSRANIWVRDNGNNTYTTLVTCPFSTSEKKCDFTFCITTTKGKNSGVSPTIHALTAHWQQEHAH